MAKPTFIFYTDWYSYIEEDIPEELRLSLYRAIPRYAFTGEQPEDPAARALFSIIRRQMDRDAEKYEQKIEKRREAGRKGGAPKGNQNARKYNTEDEQANQANDCFVKEKQAKQADNGNVNVNGNYNESSLNETLDLKPSANAKGSLQSSDSNAERVSYDGIVKYWNELVKDKAMPKLSMIGEGTVRRTQTAARIKQYGKAKFAEALRKAAESAFLNGENRSGRTMGYDWIIKPTNFSKVLEGNYDNPHEDPDTPIIPQGRNWADPNPKGQVERKQEQKEAYEAWCKANGKDPNDKQVGIEYFQQIKHK